MKRFYIPFLLMAAAAVAACQNNAVVENPVPQKGTYIYTVSAAAPAPATKTEYGDMGEFSWSESDQISVLFNNGEEDKFFTLSATMVDGNTAVFSGEIEEGFVVGSSFDGTQWALYPANDNHAVRFAEEDGEKYPLTFYIPPVTDYTDEPISANIPMYALGEDGEFAFDYLCSAYKFTITDIEVPAVKVVFENQTTYRLSGNVKLRNQGGTYLDQAWGEGADKVLTYVSPVVDGTAVIYVPVRYYAACFQPIVTIYDAETEDIIYTNTAKNAKAIEEKGHIQPITISVSGAVIVPWSFPSQYDIEWNDIEREAAGDGSTIKRMKATADESKLYVYMEVFKNALFDNDEYNHANHCYFYFGDGSGETTYWPWPTTPYLDRFQGWLKVDNAPQYVSYDINGFEQSAVEHESLYVYEISFTRANHSALGGSSATVCFSVDGLYVTDDWKGSWDVIGLAPASGEAGLEVELP